MRELEQRLGDLEGRHNELSRSYETLQVEYSSVKSELDRVRKENVRLEGPSSSSAAAASHASREYDSSHHGQRGWDESKVEILDPVLFDVSAFCFDQGYGEEQNHRKE